MQSQSNITSTISLVCAILLWVCFFGGMCLGFVPFLGIFALFLVPVEWILAFVGVITGFIGWRASKTMDGVGGVAGILGALISGSWLLMQLLVMGLLVLMFGGAMALTMLAAIFGGGH